MNRISPMVFLAACLLLPSAASARTIHVDQRTGGDASSGGFAEPHADDGPVKMIDRAVELAEPGDTISIVPGSGIYREAVTIRKSGEPDRPITLEGNGAIIDVSRDISKGPWTEENGEWVLEMQDIPKQGNVRQGEGLAFLGTRMITTPRVPRSAEAGQAPRKPFTVVVGEDGRWRFRFPEGMKPPFEGLIVSGISDNAFGFVKAAHWRVRDLHSRGAGNDAFSLRGKCRDIVLERVSGMFCADEGMSAHADAEVTANDCLFAFNGSTSGGVSDVHSSATTYTRCMSVFNRGAGFRMRGRKHAVIRCLSGANRRAETREDLPPATTEVVDLTTIPAGPDALKLIREWDPGHPMMEWLTKIIAERSDEGELSE